MRVIQMTMLVCVASGVAWADVFNMPVGQTSLEMVSVGNSENAADTRYAASGFGSVKYAYQVGKYEVTAGQYCEFLNAVAKTDTYGLYRDWMNYDAYPSRTGCNIKRTGDAGEYSYSVASDWANRPVGFISWGDAARFANWLTNGQPSGAQDLSTTEDGSYFLNGKTSPFDLTSVTREPEARYVIPNEDEWYKAAYYDAAKLGGPGYWDYPTRSNTAPSNVLSPTASNNANWLGGVPATIGSPYYRTEVGAFAGSSSPYGTFDQAGNNWEWTEGAGATHIMRGGSFASSGTTLAAANRRGDAGENADFGFRIAYVPEPAAFGLWVVGACLCARCRRNRHWP